MGFAGRVRVSSGAAAWDTRLIAIIVMETERYLCVCSGGGGVARMSRGGQDPDGVGW